MKRISARKIVMMIVILLFACQLATVSYAKSPKLTIRNASHIGAANGRASGKVSGVNFKKYGVVVVIKVRGEYWGKPYWDQPITKISSSGNWSCDITTGGVDEEATEVLAFLVLKSYDPPLIGGDSEIPSDLETNSVATATKIRH